MIIWSPIDTGTVIITEEREQEPTAREEVWAVYTRVSANENRPNLDSQADRLVAYCIAKGKRVHKVVKEIGSGVNDARPKLPSRLRRPQRHQKRRSASQGDRSAMQLTEQHILGRNDSRFAAVDAASFAAKNLYNAANYLVRQSFITANLYLNYYAVHAQLKGHAAYQALPRKVSQQVLRMLDKNWQGFFAAMNAYRADPSKFRTRPGLPRYLDKTDGRYVLVYTIQALSKPALKRGVIVPSGLTIEVKTHQTRIAQVRIVPKGQFYVVEVVYAQDKAELVGITVMLTNESHTSKCSFLDAEPVQHHARYAGRRITRGLFRASDGRLINADVNGAYNIIRKAIPNAFGNGKAGAVVHPVGTAPTH